MGPYRAAVRPLLFALPPEAAHRVAGALLSLPLPWGAIGGVREHPNLRVELAGLPLANPVGLAAGFDKGCAHLGALCRLGFGFVVGGTITRRPRAGNPTPRIARSPRTGAIVNAMGLPNPGAAVAAQRLARTNSPAPRFVSIADEATDDAVAVHRLVEPFAEAVELNASCPNVSWGRDRDTEAHLDEVLRELVARKTKPLLVKLPPFRTEAERAAVLALATLARDRGADALTCSNTRLVGDGRLAVGRGGLSGRPLFSDTPTIVHAIREATGLPIVACGGIGTAEDALACVEAGATAVQVYTSFVYEGPRLVAGITEALSGALSARGTGLTAAIGA